MSIFNFLKNYSAVQIESASDGIVNLAAALDADGVAETAIKQKITEHELIVKQLVDANAEYNKEEREYQNELKLYNQRVNAAERAQADLTADPTNKDAEQALNELLDVIEKQAPKLEKEKREAEQAKHFLDELQTASKEIAEELKNLRSLVTEQKQAIKEAEIQTNRNKKAAEQAEILAGLRKSSNKFDVAVNALKAQSETKQKEAEALRIKAEQLLPTKSTSSSSVDKYMATDVPASNESPIDRLARLKANK